MEAQPPQFTGSPCGHHGTYTFYRGFRYTKDGISKILNLGEFFFVRISAEEDPCIGELQLLCANRNNEQQLSALRLYFLPEQTPEGRLPHHGEDEVLVASDRIVLKLDDLVTWITEEVEWNHGILAPHSKPAKDHQDSGPPPPPEDVKKEKQEEITPKEEKKESNDEKEETKALVIKEEPTQDVSCSKGTKVVVLPYQKYCRFRTILRRVEGSGENWLEDPLVIALGGFTVSNQDTRVLFCRDNFEHDELAHHELNCEYLAPTIKGKRRRRKTKTVRSTSPESNSSEECKVVELKNNQNNTNGIKQPAIKNEGEFLERLYKFMKQRNTPIHRVPHLGFKQIDLFVFYSFAQKLGGYDKITGKRLWKHVYDELGGNPGSTSAATCTRRHYEKLLLPFEKFMDGIVYKPSTRGKKSLKKKQEKENAENNGETTPVKTDPAPGTSAETNDGDTYNFTDSNHENSNSKDSNSNEFNSVCDEQTATNEAIYSDEDSKTVWSIQKQPDAKSEVDKEDTKAIKPLIIQKGQSETFAEKERKWDEIRRKNAAARKWVRQSRSTGKSCKSSASDVSVFNGEKHASLGSASLDSDVNKSPEAVKVKTEKDEFEPSQNVPTIPNHTQLSQDKTSPSVPSANHTISKLHPTVHSEAIQNVINKLENQKKLLEQAKNTNSSVSPDKKPPPCVKSEPVENQSKQSKSWSVSSEPSHFQPSAYSHVEANVAAHIKSQITPSYKSVARSEPDFTMLHTGRQSVGSMSASSAISGDTSANDEKPLLSQRRPSVIQHTEYAATTPSPTVSPKQSVPDVYSMYPKDIMQCVQFQNPKMNLPPNQLSYSMTGKVAEWLTKGVHEVVACKTPSSNIEKTVELHDKVMMPSSCKTPGVVGTGKIPANNSKRQNVKSYPKSPRSKYTNSHQRNSDTIVNGNYGLSRNEARNNAMYQKTFHPASTSYNSVMPNPASTAKYQQTPNPKPEFYSNAPYYNQQKRFKCSNVPPVLPGVGTRPSLLPFVRQQTYRASPLSDIPKTTTTTHNDYDSVVLDLSVKKKPTLPPPSRTVAPPICPSPVPEEGVCLDLSIKKKPNISNDNGIENITPPLPLSPNPQQPPATPYISPTLKPLPTLIAIQDFQSAAMETARHNYSSNSSRHSQLMNNTPSSSASGSSLVIPPSNAMYPPSTHSKMPQGIVNSMPAAYSKEIAKNLYMPSTTRHSQFSPYVIPPFFPSNWTSVVNTNVSNPKQTSNSQTSPMAYKGMVNHSVFPKDYPSQYKSQFHPVLCKDNGHYPSNGK